MIRPAIAQHARSRGALMRGGVRGDLADRFRLDRRPRPRQWNLTRALRRASVAGQDTEDSCYDNEPNSHPVDLCWRGTRRRSLAKLKFRHRRVPLAGNILAGKIEEKLIPANLSGNWPI
jgi:hypothetical protein